MGRDWTHPGLAGLYETIGNTGARILYLTSRPLGEGPGTKAMLRKIDQEGAQLPEGPVITSPDLLLAAVTREIKRKPHEFKIPALQNIRKLFNDDVNPFVLGIGNRKTDVISYRSAGLRDEQIILFNKKHKVMDAREVVVLDSITELTPLVGSLLGRIMKE
jgi:phosphatidate phosphatase LPIN